MAGAATLGNPAEGLDLRLDAQRLDAAGAVSIKLLLVPQTKALTLAAQLDEPEGGIVARAASIPGLPPSKLDLDGKATLDAFKANLAFDAGPTIGATGVAELKHDGAARRLSLDLGIAHRGMAAADGRCDLRRHHDAQGDIAFADDGAVTIARLDLASRNARLGITGGLSPDRVLDLAIAASAIPGSEGKTAANGSKIKKLAFEARVTGPAIGPPIAADLSAEGLSTPHGKLGALAVTSRRRQLASSATPRRASRSPATRSCRTWSSPIRRWPRRWDAA